MFKNLRWQEILEIFLELKKASFETDYSHLSRSYAPSCTPPVAAKLCERCSSGHARRSRAVSFLTPKTRAVPGAAQCDPLVSISIQTPAELTGFADRVFANDFIPSIPKGANYISLTRYIIFLFCSLVIQSNVLRL